MDIETLLIKYSEFLEKHGYTDSDWRDEKPFAPVRFLEANKSIQVEPLVKPMRADETIDDGFGNIYPKYCTECGYPNEIVRPGKMQCSNC